MAAAVELTALIGAGQVVIAVGLAARSASSRRTPWCRSPSAANPLPVPRVSSSPTRPTPSSRAPPILLRPISDEIMSRACTDRPTTRPNAAGAAHRGCNRPFTTDPVETPQLPRSGISVLPTMSGDRKWCCRKAEPITAERVRRAHRSRREGSPVASHKLMAATSANRFCEPGAGRSARRPHRPNMRRKSDDLMATLLRL